MTNDGLAAHAHAIMAANLYMTLGTADPDGRPWTSPVYFAAGSDRQYYWISAADARHSRNIAERPDVSIVIFDSTVVPYHGRAVYAVGEPASCPGATSTAGWKSTRGPRVAAAHRSRART